MQRRVTHHHTTHCNDGTETGAGFRDLTSPQSRGHGSRQRKNAAASTRCPTQEGAVVEINLAVLLNPTRAAQVRCAVVEEPRVVERNNEAVDRGSNGQHTAVRAGLGVLEHAVLHNEFTRSRVAGVIHNEDAARHASGVANKVAPLHPHERAVSHGQKAALRAGTAMGAVHVGEVDMHTRRSHAASHASSIGVEHHTPHVNRQRPTTTTSQQKRAATEGIVEFNAELAVKDVSVTVAVPAPTIARPPALAAMLCVKFELRTANDVPAASMAPPTPSAPSAVLPSKWQPWTSTTATTLGLAIALARSVVIVPILTAPAALPLFSINRDAPSETRARAFVPAWTDTAPTSLPWQRCTVVLVNDATVAALAGTDTSSSGAEVAMQSDITLFEMFTTAGTATPSRVFHTHPTAETPSTTT